jgi:hypothetical protein
VGSIFNCFEQVGSAAGAAIVTSIQTSVEVTHGGPTSFYGRKVGLWFIFALLAISTICLVVFMHNDLPAGKKVTNDTEKGFDESEKGLDESEKRDLETPAQDLDEPVEEKDLKMPVNEETK